MCKLGIYINITDRHYIELNCLEDRKKLVLFMNRKLTSPQNSFTYPWQTESSHKVNECIGVIEECSPSVLHYHPCLYEAHVMLNIFTCIL